MYCSFVICYKNREFNQLDFSEPAVAPAQRGNVSDCLFNVSHSGRSRGGSVGRSNPLPAPVFKYPMKMK